MTTYYDYEPGDWIEFTHGRAHTVHIGLIEWHGNADKHDQLRVSYRDEQGRLNVRFIAKDRVLGKTRNPNKLPYAEMTPDQQALVRHMAGLLSPAVRARQATLEGVAASVTGNAKGRAELIAYVRANSEIGDDDDLSTPF